MLVIKFVDKIFVQFYIQLRVISYSILNFKTIKI